MPTGIYERPPIVADRLRWLAPHVDGFRPWLARRGYRAVTIVEIVRLLSIWAEWANAAGFDLTSLEAGLGASATVFRGCRTARAPHGAAKLFIAWLRAGGVLPSETRPPSPEETWPLLASYGRWMREQRGLAESTLALRQPVITNLLEALGDDPAAYTAGAVRDFVLERTAPHGRGRAQAVASTTRSFLRYLVATGQCSLGLVHAVPGFANWQLAATPRFLPGPDLARVLDACDGEERLRDRAIVLLLAKLGLRASEAAHLRFAQIDWTGATLTVSGKAKREERLPLPQDVGDALLAYIERARPRAASDRLFLTDIAPVVPLSRVAIKCLVRRALDRAGVEGPHRGAHVLRHSAATAMLAGGASLAGVGAVLRHRSPSMTAHYAKVDFGLLAEIAQPWGGRAPC
ncbi:MULTISPECIES: tyrosine-type recombinase/integrase [unclassified Acidocella]|uniref:tyrosine-type recombinase/integrase n=1 Tax=unclassified Acidocella TaxID=2648610 RepID=UPI00028D0233|nr:MULTISPECIES: tyrosine-type recombinase/integrase [unclassified Acidocella]EKM98242.1 putative integrase/recombinase [Acidocella sp. MX-AZ02]WBO61021.1 tyrosine-type recombinase/integrase [Acidocella sp. MX-AZ03]